MSRNYCLICKNGGRDTIDHPYYRSHSICDDHFIIATQLYRCLICNRSFLITPNERYFPRLNLSWGPRDVQVCSSHFSSAATKNGTGLNYDVAQIELLQILTEGYKEFSIRTGRMQEARNILNQQTTRDAICSFVTDYKKDVRKLVESKIIPELTNLILEY